MGGPNIIIVRLRLQKNSYKSDRNILPWHEVNCCQSRHQWYKLDYRDWYDTQHLPPVPCQGGKQWTHSQDPVNKRIVIMEA